MSEETLVKRIGKVSKSGAGSEIYLKDEELEKVGIKQGDEVSIEMKADGTILVKKHSPISNVFLDFLRQLDYGEAVKVGDTFVIPIFAKEVNERDYVTVKEAMANQQLQIRDTGSIDRVSVSNIGDKGILITQGQVLEGSTQSRAVVTNLILRANESYEVPTRCVYSTEPIRARAPMQFKGIAPRQVAFFATAPSDKVSQGITWQAISAFADRCSTAQDRLADEGFSPHINELRMASGSQDLAKHLESLSSLGNIIDEKVRKGVKYERK